MRDYLVPFVALAALATAFALAAWLMTLGAPALGIS